MQAVYSDTIEYYFITFSWHKITLDQIWLKFKRSLQFLKTKSNCLIPWQDETKLHRIVSGNQRCYQMRRNTNMPSHLRYILQILQCKAWKSRAMCEAVKKSLWMNIRSLKVIIGTLRLRSVRVHCEEKTGAYYKLSRLTYILIKKKKVAYITKKICAFQKMP